MSSTRHDPEGDFQGCYGWRHIDPAVFRTVEEQKLSAAEVDNVEGPGQVVTPNPAPETLGPTSSPDRDFVLYHLTAARLALAASDSRRQL